ncbi:Ribosomal protein S18 acetylase RimI [Anaerocolumna xylanovorans DSM 12503]|uniref:Ribosomal protein S18 acetylase RimI n=1 Tax=Anaerocolumna xylanovorans DSM 12503 TaxID=1121345 RepID=A0A1M7YIP2_9FIRM|nr:Ribosomal protein S18 acetylase RimI [Anaerocolumna xylanovorans DSM 12503]
MKVRYIKNRDWDEIVALERQTYLSVLSENRTALTSKNSASPSTCFVLEAEGRVAGYLLSLPYPRFEYPHLAQAESMVYRSQNLHLHDLVIAKRYRGQGLARRLLNQLMLAAEREGYQWLSLVAVSEARFFWKVQGYDFCPEIVLPKSYGEGAVYMSRAMPVKTSSVQTSISAP